MPLELEHIPFLEKRREKELDGVYRYKLDGSIATMKNCFRRGFIAEPENKPSYAYDAITANLNSTVHGKLKKCLVNMDEWEKILEL